MVHYFSDSCIYYIIKVISLLRGKKLKVNFQLTVIVSKKPWRYNL